MLTGPQAMDNFSNGNLSVEEKRDIIAYLQSLQDNPGYGGFGIGGIGPVSEGLFAWVVGIGSLVGVADLDRRPHRPDVEGRRRKRERRQPPRDHARRPRPGRRRRSRSPTPGLPAAPVASDRRRPEGGEARRAPGRRAVRARDRRRRSLFVVSYFVFKVGDNPDTIGNLGASNVALGVCLAVTLLAMGAGIIQWARKLMGDHEIVEMRHPARRPRRRTARPRSASCRPGSRSPGSAGVR